MQLQFDERNSFLCARIVIPTENFVGEIGILTLLFFSDGVLCSILDVDDVDVSESMWADVSSLLTFVLVGALDQTGLARSKRMRLITQGI